jgi:disulfide bond formation protein DsbB
MGERYLMRKRIVLLIAALMLALSMSFGGVAFAGGHHGCSKHSQGFQSSGGQCHHKNKHHHHHNGGGDD